MPPVTVPPVMTPKAAVIEARAPVPDPELVVGKFVCVVYPDVPATVNEVPVTTPGDREFDVSGTIAFAEGGVDMRLFSQLLEFSLWLPELIIRYVSKACELPA